MTDRQKRLARILCMTSDGGGGGGDKPWDEMTWDDVIAATKTDKYKEFEIGAMKELDLGTEGIVHMQIVGIDADELADGSGYAPLTFISYELLNTSHRMNPSLTPSSAPYDEGTGSIGGWDKSEMRAYLKETIKPLIPQNVRNGIKEVAKYSNSRNITGRKVYNYVTTDDVWIPSDREIFGDTSYESLGPVYNGVFVDGESRKKFKADLGKVIGWWLRSAGSSANFRYVSSNGAGNEDGAYSIDGVALGFCL